MPAAGVFKKEVDLSLFVEISSDVVFGLVHTFKKGPVNSRQLITNSGALEETYGTPINDDVHGQGFFAAREILRNANQIWVNRVEASSAPAETPKTGLRGGTDFSLVTGTDGATSVAATRELSSSGSSFVTAGVVEGDVVEIEGGSDAGFYRVTNVAATVLTLDKDFPAGELSSQTFTVWSSKAFEAADGATSVQYSRQFTSAGGTFLVDGIKAGDVLYINDGSDSGDNGFYVISNVTGETTLTVNRDWPTGSLTTLSYTIYRENHPDMGDGSTAVAGKFSSATAEFELHGVQAGDLLIIEDPVNTGNNGTYVIEGLSSGSEDTTLDVNVSTWPGGSLSSLDFRIIPSPLTFEGESPGTWADDYTIRSQANPIDPLLANISFHDTNGFLLELLFGIDTSNVVSEYEANSAYLVPTVRTGRIGPAIGDVGTMNGGSDGTSGITEADFIGTGTNGLQAFKGVDDVVVDVLLIPGKSTQNIGDALINMASQVRGDCMVILDPPDHPTVSSATEVLDWHNGTGGFGRTTALNSSYGVTYWPWVQIYDPFNDVNRYTAPSGHAASVWAQSTNATQVWYAPAGLRRGKVTGANDIRFNPDIGERTALQATGQSVNPIVKFILDGIHIFGQKTLQRTTTALDRVNVRRMLLFVERAILSASKSLSFEPGDEVTDREFIRLVTPLLEYVRDNRGLREFLVVAASTDFIREQNKALYKIFIKPTKTSEVIEIQFVLTSQTANFEELLAA